MGVDSFYAKAPRIRSWAQFKSKILELEALNENSDDESSFDQSNLFLKERNFEAR